MITSRSKSSRPPAPALPPPVRFSRLKKIDDRVVVYEGGARNPNFKKWQEFQEAHAGKHIITPTQLRSVEGMRKALEAHPRAMELLDDGVQEQRIYWDIDGRPCAGTPDVVKPRRGKKRLVELKTCQSSNPKRFAKKALWQGWWAQVSWYQTGLELCREYEHGPVDEVFIVAVESSPPHPVTVYRVRDSALRRGEEQWREWFSVLKHCEATNSWPAYATEDVDLEDLDDDGLDWAAA
jgi:hypothetical protein